MSDKDAREEAKRLLFVQILHKYGIECGVSIAEHGDRLIYGQEFMHAAEEVWQAAESQRTQAPSTETENEMLRDPSPEELESPQFNAVWQAIKGWDLSRTSGGLYAGATGTDVCTILDALKPFLAGTQAQAAQSDRCDMCNEPVTGSVHYELPGRTHRCCRCMERMKEPPVIEGPAQACAPVAALEGKP